MPYFMAGPAVGAPMAVLAMEKLIALGGRRFIVFGWCGSISSSLSVGDVLLPTWAVSEEGTSKHYPVNNRPEASTALRNMLAGHLTDATMPHVEGPIWTTDAPYRETSEQVDSYAGQGVMGVDMEFSALCTLAAFRDVEMAALMLVSDELWHPEWKPGFKNRSFKEKCRRIFHIISKCCTNPEA